MDLTFLSRHVDKIARSRDSMRAFWNFDATDGVPATVYVPGYWSLQKGLLCPLGKYYTDPEANLAAQLTSVRDHLEGLDDAYLPHIDTFLGTPLIASAFGGTVRFFDDKDPWIEEAVIQDPRDIDRLKRPDPAKTGLTGRILGYIEHWKMQLKDRLPLTMTDLQGPLSVAIDLMGASRFYMALYDEPRRVKSLLQMISEVTITFLKKFIPLVEQEDGIHEWTGLFFPRSRGVCRLSEDNLISLSPEMYREFIHPYNEMILGEVGGGIVHWCGDGSNNFETVLTTRGLTGVHNSTMGDMDLILRQVDRLQGFRAASGRQLVYFSSGILPTSVTQARELARRLRGKPGVMSFLFYPLDDFGIFFGKSGDRGYRKRENDPKEILDAFLKNE